MYELLRRSGDGFWRSDLEVCTYVYVYAYIQSMPCDSGKAKGVHPPVLSYIRSAEKQHVSTVGPKPRTESRRCQLFCRAPAHSSRAPRSPFAFAPVFPPPSTTYAPDIPAQVSTRPRDAQGTRAGGAVPHQGGAQPVPQAAGGSGPGGGHRAGTAPRDREEEPGMTSFVGCARGSSGWGAIFFQGLVCCLFGVCLLFLFVSDGLNMSFLNPCRLFCPAHSSVPRAHSLHVHGFVDF